jgi:hypothetical protein
MLNRGAGASGDAVCGAPSDTTGRTAGSPDGRTFSVDKVLDSWSNFCQSSLNGNVALLITKRQARPTQAWAQENEP